MKPATCIAVFFGAIVALTGEAPREVRLGIIALAIVTFLVNARFAGRDDR